MKDSQNQPLSQNNLNKLLQKKSILSTNKKSFFKFSFIFLGIITLSLGGFYLWSNYLSEPAKTRRDLEKKYQKYLEFQKNYEEAMKADVYGGKTPQETLAMFIEALKKEDIDLASKYFALNEEGEINKQLVEILKKLKEDKNLIRFAKDIEKYDDSYSFSNSKFVFIYKNSYGETEIQLVMKLNKYSNVWKIESL